MAAESSKLTLLLIDDHPLFRDAIRSTITTRFPDSHCTDAKSVDEALKLLATNADFDLALLDLKFPDVTGFEGLLQIRKLHPKVPVLVVSGIDDNTSIHRSLGFGAAGFVSKSEGREGLSEAIETVLDGSIYIPDSYVSPSEDSNPSESKVLINKLLSLTPQQFKVLQMLRAGMLNKQIATELDVGATTVKAHVSEVLRKLDVNSRTQAVIKVSKIDFESLGKEDAIDQPL